MKLIENWATQMWKLWSIRLAGIAGIVGAYFVAYPDQLARLVALVPEGWREPASILAGLLIFATASGARLAKQGREE
jgi:hypothetical protein